MKAEEFPAHWVNLVNRGEAAAVLALYDEGAALLPTFSSVPAEGHGPIGAYFEKLLSREEAGVALDEGSVGVFESSDNLALAYGTYTFFYKQDGALQHFPARFTFVLDLDRSAPVLHHHSSLTPEA